MSYRFKTMISTAMWLSICIFFLSACDNYTLPKQKAPPPSPPPAAELVSLSVTGLTLSPVFSTNVSDYTLSVENGIASIAIEATASEGLSIAINTQAFTSPSDFDLMVGDNVFDIQVSNSTETRGYNLTVTRAASATIGGQALLGPISLGDYAIYDITDFSTPVTTGMTTGGTDILEIGKIIPTVSFDVAHAYLITVTGGEDVDIDDDGVLDIDRSPLRGVIHAIISGEHLANLDGWKASVLTEVAYQHLKYLLENGSSAEVVLAALDDYSRQLINGDINGDGVINATDLNIWNPTMHGDFSVLTRAERTSLNLRLLNQASMSVENIPLSGEVSQYNNINARWANDIAVEDDIAYLATARNCFLIQVDISDLTNPQTIDEYQIPGCEEILEGVKVFNGNIYLSDRRGSLFIYSLSNSLSEANLVSSYIYDADDAGNILTIDGVNYAYVTTQLNHDSTFNGNFAFISTRIRGQFFNQEQALLVLDISDPAVFNPVAIVPTVTDFKEDCSFAVKGNRAYLLCNGELMTISLNISDNPQVLGTEHLPFEHGTSEQIFISNDELHLFSTGHDNLYSIKLSDHSIVSEVSLFSGAARTEMQIENNILYVATGAGIEMIDVSDPLALQYIDVLDKNQNLSISAMNVVADGVLASGGGSDDPTFTAISKTPKPNLVGITGSIDGNFNLVELSGKFGLVANNYIYTAVIDEFRVYDISDSAAPVLLGSIQLPPYTLFSTERPSTIFDIKAGGARVFVMTEGGIHTMDVSDPENPVSVAYLDQSAAGNFPRPPMTYQTTENGGAKLYHASSNNNTGSYQVQIGDVFFGPEITDGNSIALVGRPHGLVANNIDTSSDRLYIYDSGNGKSFVESWLIDTNPSATFQAQGAGQSQQIYPVQSIDARADTVFTVSEEGLTIVDARDDFEFGIISTHPITGSALKASSNHAYIASGFTGLNILDIANLDAPKLSATINTRGEARAIDYNDEFVVFNEQNRHLHIMKKAIQAVP